MLILISIYLPSPVPTDRRRCSCAGCSSNDCPCVHTTPPQTPQTQHLPPPRSQGDQEVAPESWGRCITLVFARCNIQCGYWLLTLTFLPAAEPGWDWQHCTSGRFPGQSEGVHPILVSSRSPSQCHPTHPAYLALCDASNGAGFVWQNWVIRCWECQEDKSQNKLLSDEWFNWSIW